MKNEFAITKNVNKFIAGMEVLKRPVGKRIGLMLAYGPYGSGKSEIGEWYNSTHGLPYTRMVDGCTRRTMLSYIVIALGMQPKFRANDMFDQIVNALDEDSQPLIIDEADYLVDSRIIETIRDINDLVNTPIVLMGMEGLESKLRAYPHLLDRVTVRVKFELFNEQDIADCAEKLCEIELDDSCIRFIRLHGGGRLRMTTTWFERAERIAKRNKLSAVTVAHLEAYRERNDDKGRKQ